jgi:hypothetical protein
MLGVVDNSVEVAVHIVVAFDNSVEVAADSVVAVVFWVPVDPALV